MWIEENRENVEAFAIKLSHLCQLLRDGKVQVGDVPLDAIIDFVEKVYGEGDEALFSAVYARMMAECVGQGSVVQLTNVIEFVYYHAILIQGFRKELNSLEQKIFSLQSSKSQYINCIKIKEWQGRHGFERGGGRAPFCGRGVVYSAVTGGYDRINDPQYINPQLDYILFTDDPGICSDIWQVRLIANPEKLDNTRLARRIKILGHQYLDGYDYSIWVDGKIAITGDLQDFVWKNRGSQPMLCFNHPACDCIYEEKERCENLGKDDSLLMTTQIERYRGEGYPMHNGLIESAILVRELKDNKVVQLMEAWWKEILHGSKRDQLSFNYVCWKNDFVYDSTDLYIYGNKYVQFCGHKE